jgi:hypothetical protein
VPVAATADVTREVTRALQAYADRGVFRGFTAAPLARRRTEYIFTWLFRRPMRATFDPRSGVVAFPGLLPGVAARSGLARDLEALLRERGSASVPAHKRIDRRRCRVSGGVRAGAWSLALAIRGGNQALGVRTALALVNDVFLLLQERYPEYLVSRFDLSPE